MKIPKWFKKWFLGSWGSKETWIEEGWKCYQKGKRDGVKSMCIDMKPGYKRKFKK